MCVYSIRIVKKKTLKNASDNKILTPLPHVQNDQAIINMTPSAVYSDGPSLAFSLLFYLKIPMSQIEYILGEV